MKLTYHAERNRFEAVLATGNAWRADYQAVKGAGFRWDANIKSVWFTTDYNVAAKMAKYADAAAAKILNEMSQRAAESQKASRATDAAVEIPSPSGLNYLSYQKAGIAYAIHRPHTLIADEMGLGKTIQAIGIANATEAKRVLVVCPASLKLNWMREFTKWNTIPNRTIAVANGEFPSADVVIINYDILRKHEFAIRSINWDLLICDECHYLKNYKAARTRQVLGGGKGGDRIEPIPAKRKIFLTGTPIVNRPIELWPLLKSLEPNGLGRNWKYYVSRYCDAHHNGFALDVSGASNLEELQQKLRSSIMIRRLKKDVLADLPPKRRQIIVLASDGLDEIIEREKKAYEAFEQAELESKTAAFSVLANLRHDTAKAKIPFVLEHIEQTLDETDKLVVMCHHHDVVDAIAQKFSGQCVTVDGRTAAEDRQIAVDKFQNDKSCRLFVGTIKAAGVGLTLTAASTVIFAELDWVPGNVTQAEDRLHRIGQTNPVLVQHLVLDKSLDARMVEIIVEKQANIEQALDKVIPSEPQIYSFAPTENNAAPKQDTPNLTDAQIDAIHRALKILANACDGAHLLDECGFNKLDSAFGKSLANAPRLTQKMAHCGLKLVRKYHRQIPQDILCVLA
ncbi:MAG TPA: DEAD/DEAH box helicase [Candidatus Paceibacterota bacterium]|jgi:SWI/SNF-related matrix-associated actin-dependent regulator 1 of chromatin subfamily A|nr:DEAD/DEAH box helicase [Candidatus Paceibacterota bacterium]